MSMNRIQRTIAALLCMVLLLGCFPAVGFAAETDEISNYTAEFAGGSGTESDPYLIETKEHLDNVRNHVNAHYKMIADIVFTDADFAEDGSFYNYGFGWKPISSFAGVFDGNNHTIYGLTISIAESQNQESHNGLFGSAWNSTIKNLKMRETSITVKNNHYIYAGCIVGWAHKCYISNCSAEGTISVANTNEGCAAYAGGIVGGAVSSELVNVNGTVKITSKGNDRIGGICGHISSGSICNANNNGVLSCTDMVGGIVGEASNSTLEYCTNYGNIKSTWPSGASSGVANSGGIAGYMMDGVAAFCANHGRITSYATESYRTNAAGIVANGTDGVTISKCYNAGYISSSGTSGTSAGGIAATLYFSDIDNSYNLGEISSVSNAGGIVSFAQGAYIEKCYNVGDIKGYYAGGIVGENHSSHFSNCLYTDNVSSACGKDTITATKCSTEEMQQATTYVNWDFEETWEFAEDNEYAYPVLIIPHVWDDGRIVKEATCTDDGKRIYTCSICGETYEEVLAAGHTFTEVAKDEYLLNKATCTEPAVYYKSCICGTISETDVFKHGEINANNHEYTNGVCSACGNEQPNFAGGSGTLEDPYLIETKEHLDNVRNYQDSCFKMIADIVFIEADFAEGGDFYNNGFGWESIDNFTGYFDGNNHHVKGLFSKKGGVFNYLFGASVVNLCVADCIFKIETRLEEVTYAGAIANCIDGSFIGNCHNEADIEVNATGWSHIGGIVGNTWNGKNTITDCTNKGTLSGSNVGGIVGVGNSVSISNCHNSGIINAYAQLNVRANAGGIAALSRGNVDNCYNLGAINLVFANSLENHSYSHYCGGVVGDAYNTDVNSCYNMGTVSCNAVDSSVYLGGVVGLASDGIISNCYNVGELKAHGASKWHVTVDHIKVGGVTGETRGAGVVSGCYNTGDIESISNSTDAVTVAFAGGISGNVSDSKTKVSDCYNTGSVIARHTLDVEKDGGSLAGGAFGAVMNYATVENCYNIGSVTATANFGYEKYGGVAGQGRTGTIKTCYYMDVVDVGIGDEKGTSISGSIEEFENAEFFDTFNFENVWTMDGSEAYSFPELRCCVMETCKTKGSHIYITNTCTKPKTCLVCGATEGTAKGHTEVVDKAVVATCTETGLTEGKHCSVCNEVLVAQTVVDALGHTEVIDKAVAATCTTDGKTEGKHCSVCNTVIVAQQEVPALGHIWKDATCDNPKICTRCKASSGRPAGHRYDNGVDGTCNYCGIHRETTEDRIVMHMFRMYDPNSGEHFYTGSEVERENLVAAGWNYEGVGFTFSRTTGRPVYRLYDPITGEHLYTMEEPIKVGTQYDGKELYKCEGRIWLYEGIAFNSAYDTEVPQYRLRNPNATRGAYHFTSSAEERDNLIAAGWISEGICFYSSWK